MDQRLNKASHRFGLGFWAFFARRPGLYRITSRLGAWALRWRAGDKGRLDSWPLAAGWTGVRDLASPSGEGGETFMAAWKPGQAVMSQGGHSTSTARTAILGKLGRGHLVLIPSRNDREAAVASGASTGRPNPAAG